MQRASGIIRVNTNPDVLRAIEELQENAAAGKEGFLIMRATDSEQLIVEHHCQSVHVVLPDETKEENPERAESALGELPLEIKMLILASMNPKALANCARVSQDWRSLACHPLLWQSKLQSEFPSTFVRGVPQNTYRHLFHAKTWRDAYLFLLRRFAKGFLPPTYQQMCALLPPNACRVVLFNLPCDISGEFKMLSVYMVWAPDTAGIKEKMLYVTYATGLKAARVMKVDLEAQASELSEMTLEDMQDNVQRKLHAGATVRGVDPSRFVLRM